MPKIEMAFFSNNRIERLPEGMDQLTTLKGLFLDGNVIKGAVPRTAPTHGSADSPRGAAA
jgi:hypothetical protein